jgi:hypothetical protein
MSGLLYRQNREPACQDPLVKLHKSRMNKHSRSRIESNLTPLRKKDAGGGIWQSHAPAKGLSAPSSSFKRSSVMRCCGAIFAHGTPPKQMSNSPRYNTEAQIGSHLRERTRAAVLLTRESVSRQSQPAIGEKVMGTTQIALGSSWRPRMKKSPQAFPNHNFQIKA